MSLPPRRVLHSDQARRLTAMSTLVPTCGGMRRQHTWSGKAKRCVEQSRLHELVVDLTTEKALGFEPRVYGAHPCPAATGGASVSGQSHVALD